MSEAQWKQNLRLACQIVSAVGAFSAILAYFGIRPGSNAGSQMPPAVVAPHPSIWWLVGAGVLFACSLYLSLYDRIRFKRTIADLGKQVEGWKKDAVEWQENYSIAARERGEAQTLAARFEHEKVALGKQLEEMRVELEELRAGADSRAFQKALEDDMDFQIDGGFYVRKSEADKGLVAYCPVCWKKDSKTIPLQTSSIQGCFGCSIHHTDYQTAEGRKNTEQFWRQMNTSPRGGGPNSWMA